jgi:predicted restriction endonuclease
MGEFDPADEEDARKRAVAAVVRRQGQPEFRSKLLGLYGGRCAVSGCDVEAALEAAHILPYKGPQTNLPANGLLLRADLHILFDLGLLAVNTQNMTVLVAPAIKGSYYQEYAGKPLAEPAEPLGRPNKAALDKHRQASKHFQS